MHLEIKPRRMEGHLDSIRVPGRIESRLVEIAEKEGVTVPDVRRAAYTLFLQIYDSNANEKCNHTEQEQAS